MSYVQYSKCKKCHKIKNLFELKDNPWGVGWVCSDNVSCKKERLKTQQRPKLEID